MKEDIRKLYDKENFNQQLKLTLTPTHKNTFFSYREKETLSSYARYKENEENTFLWLLAPTLET